MGKMAMSRDRFVSWSAATERGRSCIDDGCDYDVKITVMILPVIEKFL